MMTLCIDHTHGASFSTLCWQNCCGASKSMTCLLARNSTSIDHLHANWVLTQASLAAGLAALGHRVARVVQGVVAAQPADEAHPLVQVGQQRLGGIGPVPDQGKTLAREPLQ